MKKIIFSAILSLFLFACTNSFFVSEEKEKNKEETKDAAKTGSVKISFSTTPYNKNLSRTVVADFSTQITNWEVKISKGAVDFKSNVASGRATFSDLEPGIWGVLLTGKNSSGDIVADGTSDVTIGEGSTSTCSINTKFRQIGTGSFSLTFEYPASSGINYVKGAFENNPADILVASIDSSNSTFHKAIFSKSGIPSGGHQFGIILQKGGETGEIAGFFLEAINIWDNTLSDKFLGVDGAGNITFSSAKTFNENDLSDRNANLSAITISDCILDSAFDFSDNAYDATITSDNFTFTPKRSIAGQTIKYSWNGGADTPIGSDATSAPLTIGNTGNHILLVKVTSPDRTTSKEYTFNCVRKYKVTYDANVAASGTSPTDSNYYINGGTATILGNTGGLTKTDRQFLKWNTQADGKGDSYSIGSSVSMATSDITLYAEWGITLTEAQKTIPVINSVTTGTLQGRSVTLSPYEIGKYEVTYELWYTVRKWAEDNRGYVFVTSTKHGYEGSTASGYNTTPSDKRTEPIVFCNWLNMVIWCNAYTEYYNSINGANLEIVYYADQNYTVKLTTGTVTDNKDTTTYPYMKKFANGFRLPTEAEWEFAARGGVPSVTPTDPWNHDYPGLQSATNISDLDNIAWTTENSSGRTHGAGLKQANSIGIYDMAGNVFEWCWDLSNTIGNTSELNPSGPGDNDRTYSSRVLKGGAWLGSNLDSYKNSIRGAQLMIASYGGSHIGFRIARNIGSVIGRRGYGNGFIFYDKSDDTNGWRYMEVHWPGTSLTGLWSDPAILTGAINEEIGSGKINSLKIISTTGITNSAAGVCGTGNYGNYNDWFLPSLQELGKIYDNLKVPGYISFVNAIISSTEVDSTTFKYISFSDGAHGDYNNKTQTGVSFRPIRAFKDHKPTYIVVYDKNGAAVMGTVPVDNKYYQQGEEITVLGNIGTPILQKSGFNFFGWNIKADGSGTPYAEGSTIPVTNQNIVLYAKWSDAIQITNETQLNHIRNDPSASYILMNDIDLSSYANWTPIGNDTVKFTGTLDGNGKSISGLKITTNNSYNGLFGRTCKQSVIKNLYIVNPSINVTGCAGALVGKSHGAIENCGVIGGTVSGGNDVGGLVAYNDQAVDPNGFAGIGVIRNSFSSANVTGSSQIGGLVGYNNAGDIYNCYAIGNVSGSSTIGGLVGYTRNSGSEIANCYSTGIVSGTTNVGGLIGLVDSSIISNCFYDTQTSGQIDAGKGNPRTTAEMKQQSTYQPGANDWDFTNIWGITTDFSKNRGYPYLLNNYPDIYTILYDANGGTGGAPPFDNTYYHSGDTVTVKNNSGALTKTNYTFVGWNTLANGNGTNYTAGSGTFSITANTKLFAKWTGNPYTISFDKQSGTGGTTTATATYGLAMPSATAPMRTGYTFQGYYDATTGGNQYYSNAMVSVRNWDKATDTTLYARWTGNSYTITFDMQSGSGGTTSTTATYGSPMPTGLTAPTKGGYLFTGYWDATTGGTQYYTDAMTSVRNWDKTSATTLYAQWGGTMYVSTTGNDSNNGLTTSTPKLTIQAAIDAGGIEIRVAVGTYSVTNPITISGKPIQLLGGYAVGFGSRNSYQTLVDRNTYLTKIIYVGSDNGGDGTNNYSYNDSSCAVYFDSNVSNNSLIEGFIVEGKTSGYNTSAIKINYSCSPVIRYNTIIAGKGSQSTTGIISYGTETLIENNVIYGGAEVNAGWGHTAIRCAYNITINNNTIYGNTAMDQSEGTGIALGDDSDKIISNNYIYASVGISSFYAISKIYNNVIVSSLYGIILKSSGNTTSTPSNSIIINNTIFNPDIQTGVGIYMKSVYTSERFDYPVIINNILHNYTIGIEADSGNMVMPYEMKNNNISHCNILYKQQDGTNITNLAVFNAIPVYNVGNNSGNTYDDLYGKVNSSGTLTSPPTTISQGGLLEPISYLTDFPKNGSSQYTDKNGTVNRSADGKWSIGAFEY